MERILRVSFPDEVIDRYGLETQGTIDSEDLRRRWTAEEARKALQACREAASEAALTGSDFGLDDPVATNEGCS